MQVSRLVVGLIGGIGSGKTTVSDLFQDHGIDVVDTDVIARDLTAPGGAAMPAIVAAFGPEVVAADGAMDRAAMRRRVFADPAARQRLEALLHPLIRARVAADCAAAVSPYVIVAVPLLVESGGWRERCDRILVVDCPPEAQIRRVMARSGLAAAEANAILAAQASRAERLAVADDVIVNDSDLVHLQQSVDALHQSYLCLAEAKNDPAGC